MTASFSKSIKSGALLALVTLTFPVAAFAESVDNDSVVRFDLPINGSLSDAGQTDIVPVSSLELKKAKIKEARTMHQR